MLLKKGAIVYPIIIESMEICALTVFILSLLYPIPFGAPDIVSI